MPKESGMTREKAFWNGEPCDARKVRIRIGECPFPQGWFKSLVGQEIEAVEVDYGGQKFYLADDDGSGWRKVTEGRGSPSYGHKSVTCAEVLE
jgi:hypothetical protein